MINSRIAMTAVVITSVHGLLHSTCPSSSTVCNARNSTPPLVLSIEQQCNEICNLIHAHMMQMTAAVFGEEVVQKGCPCNKPKPKPQVPAEDTEQPVTKNTLCPHICEQENMVCIKVPMPASMNADCVKVSRHMVKGVPSVCVNAQCSEGMVEMVIDESTMMLSHVHEMSTTCDSHEYMTAGSARVVKALPCKVCLDCTQDIKVEYMENEHCLMVMMPKCMPAVESIAVVRK